MTSSLTTTPTPVPLSLSIPPAGTYYEGDQFDLQFHFLEEVTVSGIPQIAFTINGTPGTATYVSGSASKTLVFRHTVTATEVGQGLLLNSAIDLNGGSIKNSLNEDMPLTFVPPSTSTLYIDGRSLVLAMNVSEHLESKVSEERTELTMTINPAPLTDLTIPLRVRGTAVKDADFFIDSTSVTIRAGETSALIGYNIKNDLDVTVSKYFSIILDRPAGKSNVTLAEKTATRVSMLDDDTSPKDRWLKISTGVQHSCGITTAGVLKCWGVNDAGQLGNGSTVTSYVPVVVNSGTSYIDVTVGSGHTCGITTANALKCWGANLEGQMGDTTTTSKNTPTLIDSSVSYKRVSSYYYHTCAITTADRLKCWGRNTQQQLGDGTSTTRKIPTPIDATVTYSQVSVGTEHSCAITTGNVLKCWGTNSTHGAIGTGTSGSVFSSPAEVDSGVLYKYVRAGDVHTCGITTSDDLKCWGANSYGQLGINSATPIRSYVPVLIDPGVKYAYVDGGQVSTCGITTANVLKCWGNNDEGQLGLGNNTPKIYSGLTVDSPQLYKQVEISQRHACAITDSNVLKCWGSHRFSTGGEIAEATIPWIIPAQNYKEIKMGVNRSCGISHANELFCWGKNAGGEVGDGTTLYRRTSVAIDPGVTYKMVSLGTDHTCAITTDDVLKCWGQNSEGQVGDGTLTTQKLPKIIDPGTSYQFVTLNTNHSCGVTMSGVLKCWGNNSSSQLGNGSTSNESTPAVIDSGVSYKIVATDSTSSCGITVSGALKCWGDNSSYQLGDGTTTLRTTPLPTDSSVTYDFISMESASVCAISSLGKLRCWGSNSNSRHGAAGTHNTPTDIDTGSSYKKIVIGLYHTCGITDVDQLKCWGSSVSGEVGNGTSGFFATVTTPAAIDAGETYESVTLISGRTCGMTSSKVSKCWGSLYDEGELTSTSNNYFPKATHQY